MQQQQLLPAPLPAMSSSSSSMLLLEQHHQQLQHFPYPQLHQQQQLPPAASSSSSSTPSFQFHQLYGPQIQMGQSQIANNNNNNNAPNGEQQQEQTMKPRSLSGKVKNEQQRLNGGAAAAAATPTMGDGEGGKGAGGETAATGDNNKMPPTGPLPEGINNQFHHYGAIPFGGMPDYVNVGDWMMAHGQATTSYPPSAPHQMPPPPPCPVDVYASSNGLLLPNAGLQLHYEFDPTTYGGMWPGYYLGNDPKLLGAESSQYLLNGTMEGRYVNNGAGGDASGPNCSSFYNAPLQQQQQQQHQPQGISPSAPSSALNSAAVAAAPSLFPTLPPPPSQLVVGTAELHQLYGHPSGGAGSFTSLGAQPPPPPAASGNAFAAEHSLLASALLPSQQQQQLMNGAPPLSLPMHQLDSAAINVAPQHSPYYANFDGVSGQPPPPAMSSLEHSMCSSSSANLAMEKGQQQQQQPPNATGVAPAATGNPLRQKRGRAMRAAAAAASGGGGGGGTSAGRPSTSLGTGEREGAASRRRKSPSRSRSVAKESSDDEKSTEEKEAERRNANNTRERIRVRDINAAFKELARLCCQHMPNVDERGLTKLNTLLKAVELIPMLEQKVEEKNQMMSARKDCIKHRLDGPIGSLAAAAAAAASHFPQMGAMAPSGTHSLS